MISRLILALLLVLGLPEARAADAASPDALLRRITGEVIAAMRQDPQFKPALLAETKLLPHFNARRATQLAMGANWGRATPEERDRLVEEFTRLLLRTYSSALASYRDQTIEFRPVRLRPGENEVTVRSVIKQAGVQPVSVDYDMENSGDGWKVVDVTVAGVDLIATYRSTFAEEVRNRGVQGLIGLLSSKNKS